MDARTARAMVQSERWVAKDLLEGGCSGNFYYNRRDDVCAAYQILEIFSDGMTRYQAFNNEGEDLGEGCMQLKELLADSRVSNDDTLLSKIEGRRK